LPIHNNMLRLRRIEQTTLAQQPFGFALIQG
jgi:hypothetical protein